MGQPPGDEGNRVVGLEGQGPVQVADGLLVVSQGASGDPPAAESVGVVRVQVQGRRRSPASPGRIPPASLWRSALACREGLLNGSSRIAVSRSLMAWANSPNSRWAMPR